MKKAISLEFFEKVLIPVKQNLKNITLEVPANVEIDMEKGRVRLDTSLIQVGDQPTYSTPQQDHSTTKSRTTVLSAHTQGVDSQAQTRRNTTHQTQILHHPENVAPNIPVASLTEKYPYLKQFVEGLKVLGIIKLLNLCGRKREELLSLLKETSELREAFNERAGNGFKDNKEQKLAEKDLFKNLLNYSMHIRKIKFKILEFSEVACYTFKRLEVREVSGLSILTETILKWYNEWVQKMGGQAEHDGLKPFMKQVDKVKNSR